MSLCVQTSKTLDNDRYTSPSDTHLDKSRVNGSCQWHQRSWKSIHEGRSPCCCRKCLLNTKEQYLDPSSLYIDEPAALTNNKVQKLADFSLELEVLWRHYYLIFEWNFLTIFVWYRKEKDVGEWKIGEGAKELTRCFIFPFKINSRTFDGHLFWS